MPRLTVFDPETLHEIAKWAAGLACDERVSSVKRRLMETYPGHIFGPTEWLFSNAGGAMYAFTVFHASLTEYLILFGTPVGTRGHTGRHLAAIWDFVIDGELWYFDEDNPFQRLVHRAGDRYCLAPGRSQGLAIQDHAWVLEYGRGFIPSLLPFGLADSLFSTLDFRTIYRSLSLYARFYVPYVFRLLSGRARLQKLGHPRAPDA
jgi:C-8 sterol isomerase